MFPLVKRKFQKIFEVIIMCGRYYVEPDDAEIAKLAEKVKGEAQKSYRGLSLKASGEIFPSDFVPLIAEEGVKPMMWGFKFPGRKLLINARSETYTEKAAFKNARRCAVPASGYFEWKQNTNPKIKYAFFRPGESLYLAGLYKESGNEPPDHPPAFVILTREAVGTAAEIHHRMPVIIAEEDLDGWFSQGEMKAVTDLHCREAEMPTEQVTFDL
jgi:putative SOS response-associated peptidase YedK